MSNVSLAGTGWFETHGGVDLSQVQILIIDLFSACRNLPWRQNTMNPELLLNCFFFSVVAYNVQVNCNNADNRELVPLHPHFFLPRCVADFARENKVFVGLNCGCLICFNQAAGLLYSCTALYPS